MSEREKDARAHELVFKQPIVAYDWPCGWQPDGCGYEAFGFPDDEPGGLYDESGPIYVPEDGIWPAQWVETGTIEIAPWRHVYVKPVPFYGSDPSAARALLEAVPAEKRREVVTALRQNLFAERGGWGHWADEMFALLLAPPAAIRDAVLEVMDA